MPKAPFERLAQNIRLNPAQGRSRQATADDLANLESLPNDTCLEWQGSVHPNKPQVRNRRINGYQVRSIINPRPIIMIAGQRYFVGRLLYQGPDEHLNLTQPLLPNQKLFRNETCCQNSLCVAPKHFEMKPQTDRKGHIEYFTTGSVAHKVIDEIEDLVLDLKRVHGDPSTPEFSSLDELRAYNGLEYTMEEYAEALCRTNFSKWGHLHG